jgi:hypothetical protein
MANESNCEDATGRSIIRPVEYISPRASENHRASGVLLIGKVTRKTIPARYFLRAPYFTANFSRAGTP